MNFEEKLIERLKRTEREVERLRVKERPAGGGGGVTDHGALTGLSDDDHPQYLLTTGKATDSDKLDGIDSTGFATAGHDHDSDYLGISAKAADSDKLDGLDSTAFAKVITLTAGDGLTGGGDLSADRTFDVLAGLGIDFDSNGAVIVDLTANYAWTGNHSFTQTMYAGSIMPHVSDLYDLGDSAHLWRKIFASELSAVVFAKYEQVLLGGWFTVSKGEGILPADVLSTDTTIDLGAGTFDVGDIIVFRGISATNAPQVEYIKIASYLSGTLYGVTRDLDGTGANDWQTGTVFANYGRLGDGRIELNAYDSPRISVFSHADTIAGFREQVRIGDLINGWDYSASTYGGAFGSYESGKANITIDPTNGIRIRNYDQTVIQLTGTEASFENVIKLGTYARLEQGTGTWGSDFTGSAIWNESDVMMVGGLNNNVKQWWGGSNGDFYASSGNLKIDSSGITFKNSQDGLLFYSGNMAIGSLTSNINVDEDFEIILSTGTPDSNFIRNGDFSTDDLSSWTIQPSITTSEYHSSPACGNAPVYASLLTLMETLIRVSENEDYTLSFWQKVVVITGYVGVNLVIEELDENKTWIRNSASGGSLHFWNSGSSDWTEYSFTIATGEDTNYLRFKWVSQEYVSGGYKEYYIDDISFTVYEPDKNTKIILGMDDINYHANTGDYYTNPGIHIFHGDTNIKDNLVVDGTIKDGGGVAYLKATETAANSDKLANTAPSSFALSILDDTNAAAVKTTLGLKITAHPGIADDDVHSFTPGISQGFMLYRKLGGATNALISYDAITGTAYCTKIAGSADVEVRTGALTGTTGTDGKLTISAHTDGKIYINNRLGSTIYGGYLTL